MTEGRKLDLEINGKRYSVQVERMEHDKATVLVNDTQVQVTILGQQDDAAMAPGLEQAFDNIPGKQPQPPAPKTAPPVQKQLSPQSSSNSLQAVMPGVVTKVLAKQGQQVKSGDILLILEAMKMENEIRAPKDATISSILVKQGEKVLTGDTMIVFQ